MQPQISRIKAQYNTRNKEGKFLGSSWTGHRFSLWFIISALPWYFIVTVIEGL
jgi:hypothetical protein